MKRTLKTAALLVALALIISLTACGGNSIVGKWKTEDKSCQIEFKDDGTYIITFLGSGDAADTLAQTTGIYEADEQTLSMSADENGGIFSESNYSIKGRKLTIEHPASGTQAVYVRQ